MLPAEFNECRSAQPDPPKHRIALGEELFRTVFLSSQDAILLLSPAADAFLDLNPQASFIFGYARQQFLHVPPRRTICIHDGQWGLLLDSLSGNRDKWLRGMACRQSSGRIIQRDIFPSRVNMNGSSCILATVHDASHREVSEILRSNARFTRFSNAVAVGAAETRSIEHAVRFCLQQVCDYAHFAFAQAHIFSSEIVAAEVPADIWHFGVHEKARSFKAIFAARRFAFPDEWYSRIRLNVKTSIEEDLEDEFEFVTRLDRAISVKSALVVPITVGRQIVGVCQYFSDQRIDRDQIFLDTVTHLAGRLGHIIEHKRAHQAVQTLSSRLVHAQDDERRQLARGLHDTTAQNVAAILMDLRTIEEVDRLPARAQHALSECISLARRSLHELRTLSYLLHPPMLDELGFAAALRIFVEGFSQRSGMRVRLDMRETYPKFPQELEITLFRMVQEGLTNARRHSESETADVRLKLESGELTLIVENETTAEVSSNYATIHPAKLGVGMRSMQERIQQLGGSLTFDISKDRTVLQASFRISETAEAISA